MRLNSSLAPLADFLEDGAALATLDRGEWRRPAESIGGDKDASRANTEGSRVGPSGFIHPGTRLRDERLTLTVREAARMLGIGHDLAYQCVKDGTIPAVTLGRRIVIPRGRFERWLDSTFESDREPLTGRRAS